MGANRTEMETGKDSLEVCSTAPLEMPFAKDEQQFVDTEAEFLRMACVFATTNLSPTKSKGHVIHKEKTRRQHYKRPKQQSTQLLPDALAPQRSSCKWVSETPSSSDEGDTEQRHKEGVTGFGSCEEVGSPTRHL